MDKKEIKKRLKELLKDKRYVHSLGVASVSRHLAAVSYTHLDVYKRQVDCCMLEQRGVWLISRKSKIA